MSRAGYSSKTLMPVGTTSIAVAASQTNLQVGKDFIMSADMLATGFTFAALVSTSTIAAAANLKLQTRISADAAWRDSKTVSITTGASNTTFYCSLLDTVAGDQTLLPLLPQARIVATTGIGDSFTIIGLWAASTTP